MENRAFGVAAVAVLVAFSVGFSARAQEAKPAQAPEPKPATFGWSIEFSPLITDKAPFTRGDSVINDDATVAVGLQAHREYDEFSITWTNKLAYTNQYDQASADSTAFGGQVTLGLTDQAALMGFVPSISYAIEVSHADTFKTHTYTDQTVTLDFPFKKNVGDGWGYFKIGPGVALVHSSDRLRERTTPMVKAEVGQTDKQNDRSIAWALEASYEWRDFKNADPLIGRQETAHRLLVGANVNFAGLLGKQLKAVKDFKFGFRAIHNASDVEANDFSRLQWTFGFKLGGDF